MADEETTLERGTVTKVTLNISYPDGSEKVTELDVVANDINGILWQDVRIKKMLVPYMRTVVRNDAEADAVLAAWEPESDWKDRPSVMLLKNGTNPVPIPTCAFRPDCGAQF